MNKNDYVLMFLDESDWEDDEDEVSFRFLMLTNEMLSKLFCDTSTVTELPNLLLYETENG